VKRIIRLRGVSGPLKGQVWEHDSLLRAGRLTSLEVILDDSSVSRKHAEVRIGMDGQWSVRDLESTNGTFVNGTRVSPGEDFPLKPRDLLQFGKVAVLVELVDATLDGPSSDQLVVAAAARSSYDDGVRRMAFDRHSSPRAGEELFALLKAGHHLVHLESEDQLLSSILNDAVSVLDAQRGVIVLAEGDGPDPKLKLRALAVGGQESKGRFHFSKRLTTRCFHQGESVLFQNVQNDQELMTQSIADGAMSSVLCVLLRTPRKKLGVLHLDRGFFQNPFTEDDLLLADAMAAHVSAGIECSQLLRKQKDLFQRTIEMLASVVELRDEYTGNHTNRVTRYAVMLAEKLELPDDQIEWIRIGTPLHDIGKLAVPDEILRAPRKLTPEEFAIMKTHTTLGAKYLAGIPGLYPVIPIVRHHHERWDGAGYPDGLGREDIPMVARIVAVADAFDAMTSPRPYYENKQGRSAEAAFAELAMQAGRQFDPKCAAAFLDIRDQVVRTMVELMPDAAQVTHTTAGSPTLVGLNTPPPTAFDSAISSEHPIL